MRLVIGGGLADLDCQLDESGDWGRELLTSVSARAPVAAGAADINHALHRTHMPSRLRHYWECDVGLLGLPIDGQMVRADEKL